MDAYYGRRLIGGFHHAIEGPYIQYDRESGFYFLFVSYGNLQQQGGYQIRVFRSDKPDGVYMDASWHTLGIKDDLDNFEKIFPETADNLLLIYLRDVWYSLEVARL